MMNHICPRIRSRYVFEFARFLEAGLHLPRISKLVMKRIKFGLESMSRSCGRVERLTTHVGERVGAGNLAL